MLEASAVTSLFHKRVEYRKVKESNGGSIINANVDVVDDVIIVVK